MQPSKYRHISELARLENYIRISLRCVMKLSILYIEHGNALE